MHYEEYTYQAEKDVDPDDRTTKIWHEIYKGNERMKTPRWFANISPYREATQEEIKKAITEIKEQEFWKWTASKYKKSLSKSKD